MVDIETGIDKLLDLVQAKKKLTVSEAAEKLDVSEEKIESWGRVLSDEHILELVYPANPLNPPFLRMHRPEKELEKKEEEEKKKKEKEKKKKAEKKCKKKKKKKKRKTRKKIKAAKAKATKFFSRFRTTKEKRKEIAPYAVAAVFGAIIVLYMTGVIGCLISMVPTP